MDNDIKLISRTEATAGLRPCPASRHLKHPKSFSSHRRGLARWDSKPKSVCCITNKNAKPTFSNFLIKAKFDRPIFHSIQSFTKSLPYQEATKSACKKIRKRYVRDVLGSQ